MTSIADRVRIAGTKHDRRVKLTPEQKAEIRKLREDTGLSYNKIAKMYKVSKRTIMFVICPEKEAVCREQFKARKADGRYKPEKEAWKEVQREHRAYKKNLYDTGEIKTINKIKSRKR